MPIIYLQHPVHGFKIANMELEAEHDEQNGWERYDPNTSNDVEATVVEVAPSNELEVKRRRGRPSAATAA